jgi:nicotinamidase-related amidase
MRQRSITALALVFLLGAVFSACGGEEVRAPNNTGVALILMECQRDYLEPNGKLPVAQDQTGPAIKAIDAMIKASRANDVPVVYVVNEYSPFDFIDNPFRNGAAVRYMPGQDFDPRIDDTAGDYFDKHVPSAFGNYQFVTHLEGLDRGRLVIAGVAAGDGIVATAREAIARGYKVSAISDAIAADTDQDREAVLRDLRAAGVQVETSGEFLSEIGAGGKA